MRLIIWLRRDERAMYISHLDLQRAMGRALRRAGLPVRYSLGFNPHPVLSFALAVPVGVPFEENWMDIALSQPMPVDGALAALQAQMPPGLSVQWGCAVEDTFESLMPCVTAAEYEFVFASPQARQLFADGMRQLLAAEEYMVKKYGKKGPRMQNIRPQVLQASGLDGDRPVVKLAAGNNGGLNPRLLLQQWQADPPDGEVRLLRLEGVRPVVGAPELPIPASAAGVDDARAAQQLAEQLAGRLTL